MQKCCLLGIGATHYTLTMMANVSGHRKHENKAIPCPGRVYLPEVHNDTLILSGVSQIKLLTFVLRP